ncbi:PriCT-2 domain-containing protein [Pelistega sp. MC2]|uniref:PriCT-2 domain-containing protein n=1 Tax=Pelistega sp. MC2 TaxID=1720297 RepID=UPI0008DAB3EC|nr:PriCT-2 domain-containing protein [Pelistega sp. MC2]
MNTNSPSSSIKNYYEDNYANVRAALTYLSSEDRQTWIKTGAALKSEYGENGFAIWDEWSQTAPNYNPRDAKAAWKSFKEGRINIGTLFFEAKRNGFVPAKKPQPLSKEEWRQKREEMQARRLASERELARQQEAARKVANERWEKAKGAQINHPYLVKKGINALTIAKYLRQEGDNLLVPARQFGELHGVQTISPDGDKRFNKNASLGGSSMMLGTWGKAKENKEIILVEGVATGATLHLATGKTVVVCFSANNLKKVAEKLAKQTDLQVVIGADLDRSGTGQKYANEAKAIFSNNAVVLLPDFTEDELNQPNPPSDFNDLAQLRGLDHIKKSFQEAFRHLEYEMPTLEEPEPEMVM